MLMLAMKSAGPKMIVSMRSLANAMSLTLIRPCAVSICASMPIRPTSRPLAFSIWVSSMSSAFTWAASWTFGSMMQSSSAPAPPTTSSTSWKVHSVVQSLTRTVRILSPQPPSLSAATMFLRAPGLASGAHASSRSRKTWSAGRPLAFSRNRGLLPGTARLERRDRSSATVPPLRWGTSQLPESSDAEHRTPREVINPSGARFDQRGRPAGPHDQRHADDDRRHPGQRQQRWRLVQQDQRDDQRAGHLQQDRQAHDRRPDRGDDQVEQGVAEQLGDEGDGGDQQPVPGAEPGQRHARDQRR